MSRIRLTISSIHFMWTLSGILATKMLLKLKSSCYCEQVPNVGCSPWRLLPTFSPQHFFVNLSHEGCLSHCFLHTQPIPHHFMKHCLTPPSNTGSKVLQNDPTVVSRILPCTEGMCSKCPPHLMSSSLSSLYQHDIRGPYGLQLIEHFFSTLFQVPVSAIRTWTSLSLRISPSSRSWFLRLSSHLTNIALPSQSLIFFCLSALPCLTFFSTSRVLIANLLTIFSLWL